MFSNKQFIYTLLFLFFIGLFGSCSSEVSTKNSQQRCDLQDLNFYEEKQSSCTSPQIILVSSSSQLESAFITLTDCTQIYLDPGLYIVSSSLVINKNNIKLVGSKEALTEIQLLGDANFTINQASGIHFESLSISYHEYSPLFIMDSYSISLQNISIIQDPQDRSLDLLTSAEYAIIIQRTKYLSITESYISGGIAAGILLEQIAYINFKNNILERNNIAISMTHVCNTFITNNIFQDNTTALLIHHSIFGGLTETSQILENQDILIEKNIIYDNNRLNFCQKSKIFFSDIDSFISNISSFLEISTECHIPSGTGLAILGARNIEIKNNSFSMQLNTDILLGHNLPVDLNTLLTIPSQNIYIHQNQFTQNISRWEELVFSESSVIKNFNSYLELVNWFSQFFTEDEELYFSYLRNISQEADDIQHINHSTSLDSLVLNLARLYNSRFVIKYLIDGVLDILDDATIQLDFNSSLLSVPNIVIDGFDGAFDQPTNINEYNICIDVNNSGGKGGVDLNSFDFPTLLDLNLPQATRNLITGHTVLSNLVEIDPARLFIEYIRDTQLFDSWEPPANLLSSNINNLLSPLIEQDKILYLHGGKYISILENNIDTRFNVNSYGIYSINNIECQDFSIEINNLDFSSVFYNN